MPIYLIEINPKSQINQFIRKLCKNNDCQIERSDYLVTNVKKGEDDFYISDHINHFDDFQMRNYDKIYTTRSRIFNRIFGIYADLHTINTDTMAEIFQ